MVIYNDINYHLTEIIFDSLLVRTISAALSCSNYAKNIRISTKKIFFGKKLNGPPVINLLVGTFNFCFIISKYLFRQNILCRFLFCSCHKIYTYIYVCRCEKILKHICDLLGQKIMNFFFDILEKLPREKNSTSDFWTLYFLISGNFIINLTMSL